MLAESVVDAVLKADDVAASGYHEASTTDLLTVPQPCTCMRARMLIHDMYQ